MKKALLVLSMVSLLACNNEVKIDTGADGLAKKADTLGNRLADSVNAKGDRLIDSGKVKSREALDTLKAKVKKLNRRLQPIKLSI